MVNGNVSRDKGIPREEKDSSDLMDGEFLGSPHEGQWLSTTLSLSGNIQIT